ncbi:MAG: DUF3160 domain-containing protein [Sandaracinus sp.]|nr:DUF3160 domain-containing protein [Sandaracinus sp.]MCB9632871.1 DUF3160 domain-containing protein [Sandaracinus sp.]
MRNYRTHLALVCALALGCQSPSVGVEPGTPVPVAASEVPAELQRRVEEARNTTTAELLERADVPFEGELGYDPLRAEFLDLVQDSTLAMSASERARLGEHGFVVTDHQFPSFAYGLQTIYLHDLPIYVSADAILEAVHRSYDDLLKQVELTYLQVELGALLDEMHGRVDGLGDDRARADADLFLAVARSLLSSTSVAPRAGASASEVHALVDGAVAHEGSRMITLFGVERDVDFSQFEPRGHYDEDGLEPYFRTMTWLGRTDFRIVETLPDGSAVFRRRQLEGAVALRALLDEASLARWSRIDEVLRVFVGEPDGMAPPDVDTLFEQLGASSLASFDDDALVAAIYARDLGRQEILSRMLSRGPGVQEPLPLDRSFFFFPQRYVLDSHVTSNVVWDRVQAQRMMADPLDVAYAALGNDQAGQLLAPELARYDYAGDLEAVRVLADEHGEAWWSSNLYNRWLGALRELSPSRGAFPEGLPSAMRSEAWGRRLLNTQLSSWATLRHDTTLYAKPSYTTGGACEFPDAYVDPYPAFWEALAGFARHAREAVASLEAGALTSGGESYLQAYLQGLEDVASRLRDMAERELRGEPFTAEQLAWINEAVTVEPYGCEDDFIARGWYGALHLDATSAAEEDPVVADVHTQPTDEVGTPVGRVLHVGTGAPRVMVVTVDTCVGPRAYVGLVSTFHQHVTQDFERWTDPEWAERVRAGSVASPAWWSSMLGE